MKKKLYIVLLSVSLVLALASAGVCFADSSSTPPVFTFGEDSPEFSQLIDGMPFYFGFTSLPSVMDDFEPLYNDVLYKVVTVSGNTIVVQVQRNAETRPLTAFDYTTQLLGFKYSSGTCRTGVSSLSNPSSDPSGWTVTPNLANISVSYGSTFEWTSGSLIGEVVDFSLYPGYALVIDGPCEIVERSYYINNSWDFTKNGNMRVNGAFENDLSATYIRDGYSPDLAYSRDDLIQWEALNSNLLGTASNYESYNGTLVDISQGETYVIGYPQLYGFGNSNSRFLYTNSVNLVGHVYINYRERPSFRYVALESLSEFTNTGDFYTYSVFRPAVADVEGDVSEGSGGIVITPSDPLPSGGGNAGQPPVDEDGSLLGTISRFVNDIKRLLSSAVEAINTLVNDGSSFMQSIGTMFTWLPAPLTTLIIAGFTILLVVGVLKVLWR